MYLLEIEPCMLADLNSMFNLSSIPYKILSNISFGISLTGISSENFNFFESSLYIAHGMLTTSIIKPDIFNAPSFIVLSHLISLFISISFVYPRPVHFGQAPYGLLNENERGANSSIDIPQSGHAYFVLRSCLSPSISISTIPSAAFNAFSRESVNLLKIPSFTINLSTTMEIVCL